MWQFLTSMLSSPEETTLKKVNRKNKSKKVLKWLGTYKTWRKQLIKNWEKEKEILNFLMVLNLTKTNKK